MLILRYFVITYFECKSKFFIESEFTLQHISTFNLLQVKSIQISTRMKNRISAKSISSNNYARLLYLQSFFFKYTKSNNTVYTASTHEIRSCNFSLNRSYLHRKTRTKFVSLKHAYTITFHQIIQNTRNNSDSLIIIPLISRRDRHRWRDTIYIGYCGNDLSARLAKRACARAKFESPTQCEIAAAGASVLCANSNDILRGFTRGIARFVLRPNGDPRSLRTSSMERKRRESEQVIRERARGQQSSTMALHFLRPFILLSGVVESRYCPLVHQSGRLQMREVHTE